MKTFFTGLHQPSDAKHIEDVFISVNRIRDKKRPFEVGSWIMDSGAFTEVSTHGRYRHSPREYADQIYRWSSNGNLLAAVSQDYMCEEFILKKTGLTVERHQELTVERYRVLTEECTGVEIIPVLQGYAPYEYVRHIDMYGSLLTCGKWTGVGSICKRNADPISIFRVLSAIKDVRPDLRLHGFGLKKTALMDAGVRSLLETSDSMAWSFAARREGRNQNDWREAATYKERVMEIIN